MKSKGTPGRNRKRQVAGRTYLQICQSYKIRRLTERELEHFRKGVQAVIDRTVRA